MTRRNSESTVPPLAIRLFYLAAVAVSLPLLMWNGLVQQMNASAGDILFWTRGLHRGHSRLPASSPAASTPKLISARIQPISIVSWQRTLKPAISIASIRSICAR